MVCMCACLHVKNKHDHYHIYILFALERIHTKCTVAAGMCCVGGWNFVNLKSNSFSSFLRNSPFANDSNNVNNKNGFNVNYWPSIIKPQRIEYRLQLVELNDDIDSNSGY